MVLRTTKSAVQTQRRRRRSPRSCEECRRRKVKCDRKEPCCHCVLSKSSCVYNTGPVQVVAPWKVTNLPTHLPALNVTPPQASEASLSRDLSTFQQSVPDHSLTLVSPHDGGSGGGNLLSTHPSSQSLNKENELNELNRRVRTLEQLLSICAPGLAVGNPERPGPQSSSNLKDTSCLPQDKRVALNKSRLFGQTHWTNAAHEVSLTPDRHTLSTSADSPSSKK